jgi:hypothetical protein
MKLHDRIKRLELKRGAVAASEARKQLSDNLEQIASRLEADGDVEHNERGSVAENLVRAWLRGDTVASSAMTQSILARF